jgi:hypothetical protein
MASYIDIVSVTGTAPYNVYVCNTLGTGCVLVYSGLYTTPFAITLPSIFDNAPAVMVKLVDANNCESIKIETCNTESYLIVHNEGLCGTYYVTSGGTFNGRPYYNYVNDFIGYSAQTISIYWNGVDRWVAQKTDTLEICMELVYDRPEPVGTTSEWVDVVGCICTASGTFFYTEFVS